MVATTSHGTIEARLEARRIAAGDRIVLLVPIAMEECHAVQELAALIEIYPGLVRTAGVPDSPYACVCRRPEDVAAWFQIGRSTIVAGSQCGRWRVESGPEQLARALRREGYAVRFVAVPPKLTGGASPDVA